MKADSSSITYEDQITKITLTSIEDSQCRREYYSFINKSHIDDYCQFKVKCHFNFGLVFSNDVDKEDGEFIYTYLNFTEYGFNFSNHDYVDEHREADENYFDATQNYKYTNFESNSFNQSHFTKMREWTLQWFDLHSQNNIFFQYFFGVHVKVDYVDYKRRMFNYNINIKQSSLKRKRNAWQTKFDEWDQYDDYLNKEDNRDYCIVGSNHDSYESDEYEQEEHFYHRSRLVILNELKSRKHWLLRSDFKTKVKEYKIVKKDRDNFELKCNLIRNKRRKIN
jgi:hypothetical protein